MPITVNDGGVLRTLGTVSVNDGGVIRNLSSVSVNDGGVIREILNSSGAGVAVSTLSVGSTVIIRLNGTPMYFIVVHQGKPSSMYDSSCNGTWLLMRSISGQLEWRLANSNSYKESALHEYLNGSFLTQFDANIKNLIKQVKIPYVNGTGDYGAVASGSNGLSAKIFLLSGYEVGLTQSMVDGLPIDGYRLSYFNGTSAADSKRIGYLNGSDVGWWLRSPYTDNTGSAWFIGCDGGCSYSSCFSTFGVRPALVLDSTAKVDEDGYIL